MPEKVMRKVVSDTLTKRFLLNRERKTKNIKPDFKCAQEQHRLNMKAKKKN